MSVFPGKRSLLAASMLVLLTIAAGLYTSASYNAGDAETEIFQRSGNKANDVIRALVQLGELETPPSDPMSSIALSAIKEAERSYGLSIDGVADGTLLDRLTEELARRQAADGPSDGLSLDDWSKIGQIVSTIGGLLLGFLAWFSPSKKAS